MIVGAIAVSAQGRGQGQGQNTTARAAAPFDMTGFWVSIVIEDWRWRMLTPPKGDFASVPLNAEGRRVADGWDYSRDAAGDNQCRAFGAAAVMRRPGRVRIEWQDDETLRIDTSAGSQARLLRFRAGGGAPGARTWQGRSMAEWQKQSQVRGLGFGGGGRGGFAGGYLKVVTTNLRAGYLRPNGVPYSEDAVVTEYYYRHAGPRDLEWLTVTTIVDDPRYLTQPFITSTDFRKEADGSRFAASPCTIDPPRLAVAP
ncbi:MAG: hypothetical protein HY657_02835 [Acidobacteria bacterium]|nr:hypothetical protein [Acidobacteriota bacterium]